MYMCRGGVQELNFPFGKKEVNKSCQKQGGKINQQTRNSSIRRLFRNMKVNA